MDPFNNNNPQLNPAQVSDLAKKRPLEEESEQETKRQKLEKGMARVYNHAVDEMAINEKEPRIQKLENRVQQLEFEKSHVKAEKIEANPTKSSSSHQIVDAMDIDGDINTVKPNIAIVQSKTERVTKPNFNEVTRCAAERKELINRQAHETRKIVAHYDGEIKRLADSFLDTVNNFTLPHFIEEQMKEEYHARVTQLREECVAAKKQLSEKYNVEQVALQMKHIEIEKEFLSNLIQENSEDLSQKINWFIQHERLELILKEIDRPFRVSLLLWSNLHRYCLLENKESIRLNFNDTMIYVIPITQPIPPPLPKIDASPMPSLTSTAKTSLVNNIQARQELATKQTLKNFYMPKELLDLANQMLTQGLKIPTASELNEVQKYAFNQVMKFLEKPSAFPESTIDKWNSQVSLLLTGAVDLAYESDGAIPITQEIFIKIESFPKEFWNKWLVIEVEASDGVVYILLTRNDFKKHLPDLDGWIDLADKKSQFLPFKAGYGISDYIRFFKGMKSQDVSIYTLEETLKLFNISIFHGQREIIPACEKRLMALLNADNVGEMADKLPLDLKVVAPSLHTKMKRLLWDQVDSGGWTDNVLSVLSDEQKNLMDTLSEPLMELPPGTFQSLAKHFSSHIKKLTLNDLPDELLPLLRKFTGLKELEIQHLEYTEEMANTLQQLPHLDSLSFKSINLISTQKQPSIKTLRLQSDDIKNIDKLFSVFNSLIHLEIPKPELISAKSKFAKFFGKLTVLQQLSVNNDCDSPITFDPKDLLKLKRLHAHAIDIPLEKTQLSLLEELDIRVWDFNNSYVQNCPNLKKLKIAQISSKNFRLQVNLDLKHLSKLEDIHIEARTIKREVIEGLSTLLNLTHIRIEADVLLGDKLNPIDDLIQLPKLKSLACKAEFMTQDAYAYAMNKGIKVEIYS